MSRSTRTLIAVMLFVLAGFLILNNIVQSAPAGDWLLPLGVLIAGAIFLLYRESTPAAAAPVAEPDSMPTLAAAAAPMQAPTCAIWACRAGAAPLWLGWKGSADVHVCRT